MKYSFVKSQHLHPYTGPPEQEGQRGCQSHQKFSVDVPFFAEESVKCALFERSTQNVHENQQAKSQAS